VPYVLVLWLSIIVLVPFDLTTIDSGASDKVVLVKRIINLGKQWIDNVGKLRDAGSIMLSKLITRPDVVKAGECDILL
jgi:tubulin-specific chaperone D